MSSEIVYEQSIGRIPASHLGAQEDIFVVVQLSGDSRTYESGTRRRSRDWRVAMAGTRTQVMSEAIRFAADFESRMVKWKSAVGAILPEEFISKVRKQLANARELGNDDAILCGGHTVFLRFQLPSVQTGGTGSNGKVDRFHLADKTQMREFYSRLQEHCDSVQLRACVKASGPTR